MMGKIIFICVVFIHLFPTSFCQHHQIAYAIYNGVADDFFLALDKPVGDKYVARANYSNTVNQTGWATLEVTTDGTYPDSIQVRAAGYLEGFLSHELIYLSYLNTLKNYCDGNKVYCIKLRSFLTTNTQWAKKMYTVSRNSSSFWHQVGLFYEQLDGMANGWNKAAETTGHSLGSFGVMWFNIFGDIFELEKVLGRKDVSTGSNRHMKPSCSALIKVLPNFSDILASHVTWNGYGTMIRILKKYHLEVHITNRLGSPMIPGHTMSFSSYPGVLYSGDDFTTISSGLMSMETTNTVYNADLFKLIKPTGQILEGIRSTVANRLANSGKEWTYFLSFYNSGTYNNQWMIIDYKRFKPGKPLPNGLLWVLEQLPSYIETRDMTAVLRSQSYWSSFNIPYFPTIFNLSGQAEMMNSYGSFFSHDKTPRARIFRRDQKSVTDINSMIKLMRSNNYLKDPLSRCDDCPLPVSAENAISARNDLNPINSTFSSIWSSNLRTYGATDCKITSSTLVATLDFIAVSGPPYDPLPPFQFSSVDFDKTLPHYGLPDLWKFPPFHTQWST